MTQVNPLEHAREQYHNPGPIMSGIDDDVGNKDDIAL